MTLDVCRTNNGFRFGRNSFYARTFPILTVKPRTFPNLRALRSVCDLFISKKEITISVVSASALIVARPRVRQGPEHPDRSKCVPFSGTRFDDLFNFTTHAPASALRFRRSDPWCTGYLPIDLWRCFVAAARQRNSFGPARAARGPTTTVAAARTSAPRSARSPSKRRRRNAWCWHRRVSSLQTRKRSYEIRG